MRLDGDDTPVKKVPGASGSVNAEKKEQGRRDNNRREGDRRDNRNNRPGNKPREEFAPGTIGYILAHQKKR